MKYTVVYLLLSVLPSLLAFRAGAPTAACNDLKPQHGVQPGPNDGFYLLGDVFNGTYIPGRTYQSKNVKIDSLYVRCNPRCIMKPAHAVCRIRSLCNKVTYLFTSNAAAGQKLSIISTWPYLCQYC